MFSITFHTRYTFAHRQKCNITVQGRFFCTLSGRLRVITHRKFREPYPCENSVTPPRLKTSSFQGLVSGIFRHRFRTIFFYRIFWIFKIYFLTPFRGRCLIYFPIGKTCYLINQMKIHDILILTRSIKSSSLKLKQMAFFGFSSVLAFFLNTFNNEEKIRSSRPIWRYPAGQGTSAIFYPYNASCPYRPHMLCNEGDKSTTYSAK
jgi:hypothetical protein